MKKKKPVKQKKRKPKKKKAIAEPVAKPTELIIPQVVGRRTGPMSRKAKLEKTRDILKLLQVGHSMAAACRLVNITPNTFLHWRNRHAVLRTAVYNAEKEVVQIVESAVLKSATGGAVLSTKKTYYEDGKVKSEEEVRSAPNVVAQIFYLTNKAGHTWKDRRTGSQSQTLILNPNQKPGEKAGMSADDERFLEEQRRFLLDNS